MAVTLTSPRVGVHAGIQGGAVEGSGTLKVLSIPSFWCPSLGDPAEPAPPEPAAVGRLGTRAAQWLESFGLGADSAHVRALASYDISRLVTHTAPRAQLDRHGEGLEVASLLNMWYHAFDDTVGDAGLARLSLAEHARLSTELSRVVTDPAGESPSLDPFVLALRDVCVRVQRIATREQYAQWAYDFLNYLLHELGEAARREMRVLPGLEEYAGYCKDGRAAMASLDMVPIVSGYRVAEAEMAAMRYVRRQACLVICWDNDNFSLPKELAQRDHASLPILLARDRGESLQAALYTARAMRDQVMSGLMDECRRLDQVLGPEARRYLADILDWIRGQVLWGTSSPRFTVPGAVMPAGWADGPAAVEGDLPATCAMARW
jgi:hypothetical protein